MEDMNNGEIIQSLAQSEIVKEIEITILKDSRESFTKQEIIELLENIESLKK